MPGLHVIKHGNAGALPGPLPGNGKTVRNISALRSGRVAQQGSAELPAVANHLGWTDGISLSAGPHHYHLIGTKLIPLNHS